MPDSLRDLESEKNRLHGPAFYGVVARIDTKRMILIIKDSRSEQKSANLRDVNQAKLARGVSVGSWSEYTIQEAREIFV